MMPTWHWHHLWTDLGLAEKFSKVVQVISRFIQFAVRSRLCLLLFVFTLFSACGGSSTDDGALTAQVATPGFGSTLVLRLTDSTGAAITTNTIDLGTAAYIAQATLRESAAASGAVITNRLIKFTTDAAFGTFVNGSIVETASTTGTITTAQMTALTDINGVAKVQLVGKRLGAATLFAEALVGTGTSASNSVKTPLDYQVKSLSATAGVNLLFNQADPGRMVISTATTGPKTSALQFRLVNELGVGMSGQPVQLSLDSQSVAAGVAFINAATGVSSTAPLTVLTDFNGIAKATVGAGPLPTGVVITAVLLSNPTVKASSVGMSVSSGRVSQKSMSVSSVTPAVEGFTLDNAIAELNIIATDRLGNPVPAGTIVNFVTSHGLVGTFDSGTTTKIITSTLTGTATAVAVPKVLDSKGSCTLDPSSSCKVQLISSGNRPANGLVTVLAYADGEETFIDLNGNNSWDKGEPFTDMGVAYLDVNANDVYELGVDQSIPGDAPGSTVCLGTGIAIKDTCDGTWSPFIRSRQKLVVTWSTSQVRMVMVGARTGSGFVISMNDLNGNLMATASTYAADLVAGSEIACRVLGMTKVPGSTTGQYQIFLNGDVSCAGAAVRVIVTAPSGTQTIQVFN
ncbi:MAG: hypothetical protein KA045_00515 [Burkholderiaceae bacterium]|jgi:hypothetical protein|nr:hypothetical protein [Burkholderiaceae bacterium]